MPLMVSLRCNTRSMSSMAFTHATRGNLAVFNPGAPEDFLKTLGFPPSAHAKFGFTRFPGKPESSGGACIKGTRAKCIL